jgi:hypothetical protein
VPDDRLTRTELAEMYGYQLSLLKSEPELWAIFKKAVDPANTWTKAKFQAEVKKTKWYKNTSDVARQNQAQRASDSATFDARLNEAKLALQDAAAAMGATLSAKTLNKMASDAMMYGWSTEKIRNKLAGYIDVVKGTKHFGGEAGDTEESLRKLGLDFGQKISDKTLKKWVRQIARGNTTVNDFEAIMRKQAEVMYPAYADQIKKGFSMRDIADPYIQQMASTLELDPGNIDIFDKSIQSALKNSAANDKGGKKEFSMYDFEVQLRKDPRWNRTKAAQDQAMALVAQIKADWGM